MTRQIPYGYCQCGCGQRTEIVKETCRARGIIKGQPLRFIHGHNSRMMRDKLRAIRAAHRVPPEVRFWSFVDKRGDDECWPWKGGTKQGGYGIFHPRTQKDTCLASHFSYELAYGTIPDGLFVLHHCDNPACVNPAHLFLGTALDNSHDMLDKGRNNPPHFNGAECNFAKLTDEQVIEIRRLRTAGIPPTTLAKQFKVTYQSIWQIVTRKTWRHI